MTDSAELESFGPWNPGIQSRLPANLWPLMTLLRPENVFTDIKDVKELADFTGMRPRELVRFRPERLVVHELLIRVSADFQVADGSRYEDLGINTRAIVAKIFNDYVKQNLDSICTAYEELIQKVEHQVHTELSNTLFIEISEHHAETQGRSFLERLGFKSASVERVDKKESREELLLRVMATWQQEIESSQNALSQACFRGLHKITSALYAKHGDLRADQHLLTRLVTDRVMNSYGSEMIGGLIEPFIEQARVVEGYRRLPVQSEPVIMNTKGASASGKSTMRPRQHELATRLGINWEDFALISPDIWRKYLLDYDSLESHYKYAGTLTGDENAIIDRKLDRYMSAKAARGCMSHLLIDRFRFDSFDPDAPSGDGSNLLTRFGHLVYMFFVITPPHATVERAWTRGLKVGRFKAVDDLLDHNVEAFTGMPKLFFTWTSHTNMSVHFEFLDNSVPENELPPTIAYGVNDELNILDIHGMLNIDRYRKININALSPNQVYPNDKAMAASENLEFLRQCVHRISKVNFIDAHSGCIYAHIREGALEWIDPQRFAKAIVNEEVRSTFTSIAPEALETDWCAFKHDVCLKQSAIHTLGQQNPEC